MKRRDNLFWILAGLAGLSLLGGLAQAFSPQTILRLMQWEDSAPLRLMASLCGAFTVLFAGALLSALASPKHHPLIVLWAGLQSLVVALILAIGIAFRVSAAPFTYAVAVYDFLAGLLTLAYWPRIRRTFFA